MPSATATSTWPLRAPSSSMTTRASSLPSRTRPTSVAVPMSISFFNPTVWCRLRRLAVRVGMVLFEGQRAPRSLRDGLLHRGAVGLKAQARGDDTHDHDAFGGQLEGLDLGGGAYGFQADLSVRQRHIAARRPQGVVLELDLDDHQVA